MAANDPGVRTAIATAGGKARMAMADTAEVKAHQRRAAAAAHSPATLATRIVKAWPGLSRKERAEVRDILGGLS